MARTRRVAPADPAMRDRVVAEEQARAAAELPDVVDVPADVDQVPADAPPADVPPTSADVGAANVEATQAAYAPTLNVDPDRVARHVANVVSLPLLLLAYVAARSAPPADRTLGAEEVLERAREVGAELGPELPASWARVVFWVGLVSAAARPFVRDALAGRLKRLPAPATPAGDVAS